MSNIDSELINWVIEKIKSEYKEDVALLIGQLGACKIPTDEQTIAFDFFVPCTKRGEQLAQTFIIDEMGYDLFPMSWERLEGIADLNERITFALAKGVVLYAKTKEDENHFLKIQQKLQANLKDKTFCRRKALEKIDSAMNIFKNMIFNEDLSHVRKAAGGIMQYLATALLALNGDYLKGSYGQGQYLNQIKAIALKPDYFVEKSQEIILAQEIGVIKHLCFELIQMTRQLFVQPKAERSNYNDEDLAQWYYEARYSFRRLTYYCKQKDFISSYELGCYLQIELDVIEKEFDLQRMDLLGTYYWNDLDAFEGQATKIEQYLVSTLKERQVNLKIYKDVTAFLTAQK